MSDIRAVKNLLKDAQENGFEVKDCGNVTWVYSLKNKSQKYLVHMGKRALHPLRRFIEKNK
jgi:hypothetical protein